MKNVGSFLFIFIVSLIDSSRQQGGNCDCKKKEQCKPWVDAINQGKYLNLPVCGFDNNYPHTPLLCCPRGRIGKRSATEEYSVNAIREAQQTPQSKFLSSTHKAAQKCADYSKAVFQQVQSPRDPTAVVKVDSCGVESLLTIPRASPQEYRHQALIGYGEGEEKKIWICAGILISERFVITSAICSQPPRKFKSSTQWVKFGEGDRDSTPQVYRVIERVEHPEYDKRSLYNANIALLKLEKDVEFGPTIHPACVYTASPVPDIIKFPFLVQSNQDGEDIPTQMVQHNMKLVSNDKCNETITSFTQQGVHNESVICARHFFRNQHECKRGKFGMSTKKKWPSAQLPYSQFIGGHGILKRFHKETLGSSMVIPLKKPYCMHALVGVTFMGTACGEETVVGTRISHYLSWIVDHVWPE